MFWWIYVLSIGPISCWSSRAAKDEAPTIWPATVLGCLCQFHQAFRCKLCVITTYCSTPKTWKHMKTIEQVLSSKMYLLNSLDINNTREKVTRWRQEANDRSPGVARALPKVQMDATTWHHMTIFCVHFHLWRQILGNTATQHDPSNEEETFKEPGCLIIFQYFLCSKSLYRHL